MKNTPPKWLTVHDYAKRNNLSKDTIMRRIKDKTIKGVKIEMVKKYFIREDYKYETP